MEQRRNIIRGQRGNIFPRIIFLEYIEVPVIFSKALKTVLDELFGSKYADGWMDHEADKTLGRPRCIVGDICYRSIFARAPCHLHNASRWKLGGRRTVPLVQSPNVVTLPSHSTQRCAINKSNCGSLHHGRIPLGRSKVHRA